MTGILLEPDHVVQVEGAGLATDVYRPADQTTAGPCLLQRVPYGRAASGIANSAMEIRRAVDAGFVVVVQDCRGRGGSTGRFEPFVHEAADGAATLDWLTEQEFCDGRVGMFGRSYAGYTQWAAASTGHTALRALAPIISGSDIEGGWLRPDGVVEWGFALWWTLRYLSPGLVDDEQLDDLLGRSARPEELLSDRILDDEGLMAALPFLRDWAGGHVEVAPLRVPQVPALVVAGWFDVFARSCLDTFASIRTSTDRVASQHRLVIGPWAHGGSLGGTFPDWSGGPSSDAAAIDLTGCQLEWFSRWMQPQDEHGAVSDPATVDTPTVRAFMCGDDEWVDLPDWPGPHQLVRVGSHDLVVERPVVGPAGVPLGVDVGAPFPSRGGPTFLPGLEVAACSGPREQGGLLDRSDVVVLAWPASGVTILGEVRAQLHLELRHESGDDVAATPHALGTVGPVGTVAPETPPMLVCVRLCARRSDGTVRALSEGASELVASAGRQEASVRVGPIGWSFGPDDDLVLLVTRASFPRFRAPSTRELDWRVHLLLDAGTWVSLSCPTGPPSELNEEKGSV